jgi:alcohol dehydrogenase
VRPPINAFDFQPRTHLVFGAGCASSIGRHARGLGFRRTLLVADRGLVAAGHSGRITSALEQAGVDVVPFHDFEPNPTSDMVASGRAAADSVDSIIGLGGGSSMDCAKGINFVLTNGGSIADYHGYGKASRPMLPMIGVPTTAGTGSEAQSYALISDAATHVKLACGDPKAAFRVALLDPELAVSQPASVRAAAGYDAISHAVETWVTAKRSPLSDCFSREAWRLLDGNFERVLAKSDDVEAIGAMLLGAHFAGLAIENSMLGAAHACANPLTARYGTTHGVAIALLLKHVVRWNCSPRYRDLGCGDLAARLDELAAAAGLPRTLREIGVSAADLPQLAEAAAQQWTGRFNPRPFDAAVALEIYRCAY